jgi:hypothetical protein
MATMKRTLATLAILFCLAFQTHAADIYSFYTGAWWDTKAPTPGQRAGGMIDIYFYDDLTVAVDLWYDGELANTGTGFFLPFSDTFWTLQFTLDGIDYTFRGTVKNGFAKGTHRSYPLGTWAGRWQAN